ncbi:30S ribosomal protein S2 [Candidatus Peregrinibacteria bacterium]|nr:MAG: 30S ribosomal protein S2 [Candidatus Peregrinibacteria bacterium]
MSTSEKLIRELAENACHFGHKTSRWNPKVESFLWGKKGGVHIFDLQKTAEGLERILRIVAEMVRDKKTILFVSTKPQTKSILQEMNQGAGVPVVLEKWVGGLLTNFETVKGRIRRLKDIREMIETGEIEKFPKKEQSQIRKEGEKLEIAFGGIVNLYRLPDALFIIDGARDVIAIREANHLDIPVYGILDSNVDPQGYTDFIPANDDAVTSLSFLLGKVYEILKSEKSS